MSPQVSEPVILHSDCTMHFLTVSLFFSFFLVTQATDLSSELNQPPLSESVYIFVVNSDAPIEEIKGSFSVTGQPLHSFRAIGENTYYFVLSSNSTIALRQLTFPIGSDVTQYPVAHFADFYKMFGIETGYEENDTAEALFDNVLTYIESDYHFPKGIPVKLYDLITVGVAKEWNATHRHLAHVGYMPVAYYPLKVIAFTNLDGNALQRTFKDIQDVIGGIGIINVKTKHIVKT